MFVTTIKTRRTKILLGEDIEIFVTNIRGKRVRLGIRAPASLRIRREVDETERTPVSINGADPE